MNFTIESGAGAVMKADIRKRLETSRDNWIARTPQERDSDRCNKFDEIINRTHNADRAAPAAMKADFVKDQSATLDLTHTEVVKQMNLAIDAVCAIAATRETPMRVCITGHVKTSSPDGILKRLSIAIDEAAYG
jgi:hypothetical protein